MDAVLNGKKHRSESSVVVLPRPWLREQAAQLVHHETTKLSLVFSSTSEPAALASILQEYKEAMEKLLAHYLYACKAPLSVRYLLRFTFNFIALQLEWQSAVLASGGKRADSLRDGWDSRDRVWRLAADESHRRGADGGVPQRDGRGLEAVRGAAEAAAVQQSGVQKGDASGEATQRFFWNADA